MSAWARESPEVFEAILEAALAAEPGQRRQFAEVVEDCLREPTGPRELVLSRLERADHAARAAYIEILEGAHAAYFLPAERIAAALLPALRDDDVGVRFGCARILGVIERVPAVAGSLAALAADPATQATLLAWLADPDPRRRSAASGTMRFLRRPELLGPLLDAHMTREDHHTWTLAAHAPDVIDRLVQWPARSRDDLVRLCRVLRECLERTDGGSVERCLCLLASSDEATRDGCLRLLGVNAVSRFLPAARLLPLLLPLSRDADPRRRSRCFHLLAILPDTPDVRAVLEALARDPDAGVREHERIWRGSWDVCPCEL